MFSNGTNDKPMTFANFSGREGNFQVNKDGQKQGFSQLRDVRLVKASVKDDEYDGQPLRKLQLTFETDTQRSMVSFNMSMGVVSNMIAMLLKADLTKPLGLTASLAKEGTTYKRKDGTMTEPLKRDQARISVYQGAYIQLTEAEMPPKTERVTVGKKEVVDSTDRDEWTEKKAAELAALLASLNGHSTKDAASAPAEPPHGDFDDLGDDIPF